MTQSFVSIKSRHFKLLGGVISLGVLFLNPWIIGKFFAVDGHIQSRKVVAVIGGLDLVLLSIALWLLGISKKIEIYVRKERLFAFVTACLTVLLCFLILEGFFRWRHPFVSNYANLNGTIYSQGITSPEHYTFDPLTGYSLIPSIVDREAFITTDQYGLRITGRPVDIARKSVIFVGDSTVFGWGVKDTKNFVYLISQSQDLKEFNVINMGVPAYSLGHIKAVLENKVARFNPALVFVQILWPWKPFDAYSSRDAWRTVDFEFYKNTIPLQSHFVKARATGEKFIPKTLLWAQDFYNRFVYRKQIHENLERPGIRDFTLSPEEEKALAQAHIDELSTAAKPLLAKGVKVVFYIHPYQYTIFSERYRGLGVAGRKLLATELGAFYPGDFLLRGYSGTPLYIDGSHMTEEGHERMADYLGGIAVDQLLDGGIKTP